MKDKKSGSGASLLREAFRATLPVMAGYLVLGAGFGMVLKSKGFGIPWAGAMSLFIYAGSMQFVAADLMASGASLLTLAVTTLLVNARHLFYGISMVDRYRNAGKAKPYLIFALTDETYSLLCARQNGPAGSGEIRYDLTVSLLNQSYWVAGSLAGALLGEFLPFNTEGIDFALTALFITVVVDQWRGGKHRLCTVMGLSVSLVCLLVFGPDNFLIPAMAMILASVFLIRKREAAYE